MPPALLGGYLYGPEGIIAGVGFGSIAFGAIGIALAFRTVTQLEQRAGFARELASKADADASGGDIPAPERPNALV